MRQKRAQFAHIQSIKRIFIFFSSSTLTGFFVIVYVYYGFEGQVMIYKDLCFNF